MRSKYCRYRRNGLLETSNEKKTQNGKERKQKTNETNIMQILINYNRRKNKKTNNLRKKEKEIETQHEHANIRTIIKYIFI